MSELAGKKNESVGESRFRSVIQIHGWVLLAMGVLHASWNWYFPGYEEFSALTDVQWAWASLLNWSVTIFMFLVAFFSLAVSRMANLTANQLRLFIFSLVVFWSLRLMLEFIYPVTFPFLFIPGPSLLFKTLIAGLILILLIPEIRTRIVKA